jgi:hypothetical protein
MASSTRRLTCCGVPEDAPTNRWSPVSSNTRHPQAHATGPHLDTPQGQHEDQAREARETGNTLEKRHDSGTGIKAVVLHVPCLQGATGDVQPLGRLALGEPLGVSLAIACKQLRALEARPTLMAIMIATVLCLAYRCHRLPLFPKSLPCEKWRAKDGEVAPWLPSLSVSSQVFARSSSRRDGRRGDQGRSRVISNIHRDR